MRYFYLNKLQPQKYAFLKSGVRVLKLLDDAPNQVFQAAASVEIFFYGDKLHINLKYG